MILLQTVRCIYEYVSLGLRKLYINMLKIHISKHGISHLSQGSKNNEWQTESVVLGEFLDRVVYNHSANDNQDWKWTKTHFLFCLFLMDQAAASAAVPLVYVIWTTLCNTSANS